MFIDLEHRVIPNRIVLPGTAVALAVWAAVDHAVLSEHALAAAAGFGLFLGMALIYPAGMGLGDVKLALMLGAFLGWSVLAGVVVAFVASAIPSVIVLIVKGKEGRKATIPFGPFLAGGGVVALLWGPALVDWYLGKH